jgi:hypothetical protein
MANRRQKGKISKSEWPDILARHSAGESLASIARHYECTPPAIRYIVLREGKSTAERPHLAASTPAAPSRAAVAARQAPKASPAEGARQDTGRRIPMSALRERITSEIAAFLVALDVVSDNSQSSLDALRAATDRLLRASARVRMELDNTAREAPTAESDDAIPLRRRM